MKPGSTVLVDDPEVAAIVSLSTGLPSSPAVASRSLLGHLPVRSLKFDILTRTLTRSITQVAWICC